LTQYCFCAVRKETIVCKYLLNMYYLYLCLCTSAKCMSVELKQFEKVYLFIWSHDFRFSMSLSLSPNSLYYRLHRRWRFNKGSLYMPFQSFFLNNNTHSSTNMLYTIKRYCIFFQIGKLFLITRGACMP
jgi:hypothetical protein